MIIRSAFTRAGGTARHLARVDSNETVVVSEELCRGVPPILNLALRLFSGIARTNSRTRRDFVHIKISPSATRTEAEFAETLGIIEKVFEIPETVPRVVVTHAKPGATGRPPHMHVVYPIVCPETGRAIRSNKNLFKDELASRLAELRFGERIVPGPRHLEVVAELTRRGMDGEAEVLSLVPAAEAGARIDGKTRQQAERVGVDAAELDSEILETVSKSATLPNLITALRAAGFGIARGDKATLGIEPTTGFTFGIARTLRRICRAELRRDSDATPMISAMARVTEREVLAACGDTGPLDEVRERVMSTALVRIIEAAEVEEAKLIAEAIADDQPDLAALLRRQHDLVEQERSAENRTLKAKRKRIRDAENRRRDARTRRVDRAFVAAAIAGSPAMRKLVFAAAATGVLLAGGGVGLTLLAGGFAVALLPSRERARALALASRLETTRDREETARLVADVYDEISRNDRASPVRNKARIPPANRMIAAAYTRLAISALDGTPAPYEAALMRRLAAELGVLTVELDERVLNGDRALLGLLRAYDPARREHAELLEAMLSTDGGGQTGRRAPGPARRTSKGFER